MNEVNRFKILQNVIDGRLTIHFSDNDCQSYARPEVKFNNSEPGFKRMHERSHERLGKLPHSRLLSVDGPMII